MRSTDDGNSNAWPVLRCQLRRSQIEADMGPTLSHWRHALAARLPLSVLRVAKQSYPGN